MELPDGAATEAGVGALASLIIGMLLNIGGTIGYGWGLWHEEGLAEAEEVCTVAVSPAWKFQEWQFYGWHCLWLGCSLTCFAVLWYGLKMSLEFEQDVTNMALQFDSFGASYYVACLAAFLALVALFCGLKWRPELLRESRKG